MSTPNPFPNLRPDNHRVTSPKTPDYNCIAWAAGETHRRWWPIAGPGWYWPPNLPKVATVDIFVEAFRLIGYAHCDSPEHEQGYEKVALYLSIGGAPTHMARQLLSGTWTSKLGTQQDIEHDILGAVEGPVYGRVALFLKRPSPSSDH